ncbi:hypothetical protein WJX77_008079 [Trebouxia sp. C0004]
MAFAPRSSQGPRRSPYHAGSLPSHTPSSKVKVSLSFDKGPRTPGATLDDACSVQSSSGSDSRSRLRQPGTTWKGDEVVATSSATPQADGTPDVAPSTFDSNTGTYQEHDNTSLSLHSGLTTPASKEGQRQGFRAHNEGHNPPQVKSSVQKQSSKTVLLSPAACKTLNEVAAQLWIIAYHQRYEPGHDGTPPQGLETTQQLTQASLAYILETGITPGSQSQTSLTWKAIVCMAGLMTLALAAMCMHVMSGLDSTSYKEFS